MSEKSLWAKNKTITFLWQIQHKKPVRHAWNILFMEYFKHTTIKIAQKYILIELLLDFLHFDRFETPAMFVYLFPSFCSLFNQ